MSNTSGQAYALTLLCPIINGSDQNQAFSDLIRDRLESMLLNNDSPMAKVPNTYLCRFFILNDVFFEGHPFKNEHLKSQYLVFSSNFHGDLDAYLKGMWNSAQDMIKDLWEHCVAFDKVKSADDFIGYIKKCQLENSLFFNGSTDDSLAEQLKSLYIKQEFSRFVHSNQGLSAEDLQASFNSFIKIAAPNNLDAPTWKAGSITADEDHNYQLANTAS